MRSRLAWLLGIAGLLAYLRRVRRHRPAAVEPAADTRAKELRAKLDETRAETGEPAESGEPAEAEPAAEDLDERRRQVHETGRAAVDQMRGQAPVAFAEPAEAVAPTDPPAAT